MKSSSRDKNLCVKMKDNRKKEYEKRGKVARRAKDWDSRVIECARKQTSPLIERVHTDNTAATGTLFPFSNSQLIRILK